MTEIRNEFLKNVLVIDAWDLFGFWNLGFEI
jgi:hypothetical protein